MTDEDIDNLRETMAAASPLGAIADRVWGWADDPDMHEDLIAELDGAIRAYVTREANGGAHWDEQQLAGITRLVAKAMIAQHLFSEAVCRCSCLSPFVDPIAEPPAVKWFAGLRSK